MESKIKLEDILPFFIQKRIIKTLFIYKGFDKHPRNFFSYTGLLIDLNKLKVSVVMKRLTIDEFRRNVDSTANPWNKKRFVYYF